MSILFLPLSSVGGRVVALRIDLSDSVIFHHCCLSLSSEGLRRSSTRVAFCGSELVLDGQMDANQLCEGLGRSDRGNRDWTGRRVKIGVRPWDRPCSWEGTELPFRNCEVERRKQLGCKHG